MISVTKWYATIIVNCAIFEHGVSLGAIEGVYLI